MLLGIVLGIGVSIINTRLLGPEQYGDLKFLQSVFSFVIVFFTFGIFASGSRLLAQKKNENITRELMGSLFLLALAISSVFMVFIFFFSFFQNRLFRTDLGCVIRTVCPLLFVFPLTLCLEKIMQGTNEIYRLSIFRVLPQIAYVCAALSYISFLPLSATSALMIQLSCSAFVLLLMLISLEPKFNQIKECMILVYREVKRYGFPWFLGSIVYFSSAKIGALSIAYFINTTYVGYYSLALVSAAPLILIPNAMGTTMFKDFANLDAIPKRVMWGAIFVSGNALLFYLLFIKKIMMLFYSSEYAAAVPLAYLISFGAILHGFGDLINRFLGAHGRGKDLRNSNVATAISNILGYTVLVYFMGIIGAAVTHIMSGIVYVSTMAYLYIVYTRRVNQLSRLDFDSSH
jgi:O-antigen/teichoic acid export membrane protein